MAGSQQVLSNWRANVSYLLFAAANKISQGGRALSSLCFLPVLTSFVELSSNSLQINFIGLSANIFHQKWHEDKYCHYLSSCGATFIFSAGPNPLSELNNADNKRDISLLQCIQCQHMHLSYIKTLLCWFNNPPHPLRSDVDSLYNLPIEHFFNTKSLFFFNKTKKKKQKCFTTACWIWWIHISGGENKYSGCFNNTSISCSQIVKTKHFYLCFKWFFV